MLKDIVAVQPLDRYKLHLTFEDDVAGIVDIAEIIDFTGVFAPLNNPAYFAQVTVNPDLAAIPNSECLSCTDRSVEICTCLAFPFQSTSHNLFSNMQTSSDLSSL